MNLGLFRLDQLWLTDNRKEIELFSLCEFKGMENKRADLYREYLHGIFGCVPVCLDIQNIPNKNK